MSKNTFNMQTWMYLAVPVVLYSTERVLIINENRYHVNIQKVLVPRDLYQFKKNS